MDDLAQQKSQARRAFLARRRELSAAQARVQSDALCAHLEPWLRARGVGRVGLYWPHRGEPDLRGLSRLRVVGLTLALPVVEAAGRGMAFYEWDAAAPLVPNRFGIPEPDPAVVRRVDLGPVAGAPPAVLLVPAVALDRGGHRMGYGGGYYDRFLSAAAGGRGGMTTVGVVFAEFVVARLPAEPHDHPVQFLATETGVVEAETCADGPRA